MTQGSSMVYMVPCDLTLLLLLSSPSVIPFHFCWSSCFSLNMSSLIVLKIAVSLPGIPFLQTVTQLTLSLSPNLCSHTTLSVLNRTHLHHCSTPSLVASLSFVAHITSWLVLICSWSIFLSSLDSKYLERRDWICFVYRFTWPPWRRKWQHTPVSLPGKSHGERILSGYSPWGHKSWTQLSH